MVQLPPTPPGLEPFPGYPDPELTADLPRTDIRQLKARPVDISQ